MYHFCETTVIVFSAGVAFAVIVGIALGLVIGTSMLAIVFTCRKR